MEKDLQIKPSKLKFRVIDFYNNNRKGWLRFFGIGISWKDTAIHPLMFSERNGITKGLTFGMWRFSFSRKQN